MGRGFMWSLCPYPRGICETESILEVPCGKYNEPTQRYKCESLLEQWPTSFISPPSFTGIVWFNQIKRFLFIRPIKILLYGWSLHHPYSLPCHLRTRSATFAILLIENIHGGGIKAPLHRHPRCSSSPHRRGGGKPERISYINRVSIAWPRRTHTNSTPVESENGEGIGSP